MLAVIPGLAVGQYGGPALCTSSLAIQDTITIAAVAGAGNMKATFTVVCPATGFGNVFQVFYGVTAAGAPATDPPLSVVSAALPCNGTNMITYTYPAGGTFTVSFIFALQPRTAVLHDG